MSKPTAVAVSALVGVVSAALFVAFVVRLLNTTGAKGLGSEVFNAGDPRRLATRYAENGPIEFQALQGDKDIKLLHRGGADPTAGWWALQAAAPGRLRRCALRYDAANGRFVDGCDPTLTFNLQGDGLTAFPVRVVEGPKLEVDLRRPYPGPAVPSPTTTTTSTTTPTTRAAG